jgi:oligopeptidase B
VKNPRLPVKSLLVVGYGAYGMPTALNTLRWYPLLLRGWAVCFALVRGGGDDTQTWADAARTYHRELAVVDFECVIKDAQGQVGLTSKETCVYGRSAGGILIGAAAARQKGTSLFSALYGEVPYLDVLRTTTNPKLPLTQLEYDEFGNPTQRLEDLVAVARISPMEGIPQNGYPGLFALMRTGQNDKEVFAYEPVKWILRARGKKKDNSKLLAFELNEGHFVGGSTGLAHKTSDLALLLAWRRGATFRL